MNCSVVIIIFCYNPYWYDMKGNSANSTGTYTQHAGPYLLWTDRATPRQTEGAQQRSSSSLSTRSAASEAWSQSWSQLAQDIQFISWPPPHTHTHGLRVWLDENRVAHTPCANAHAITFMPLYMGREELSVLQNSTIFPRSACNLFIFGWQTHMIYMNNLSH